MVRGKIKDIIAFLLISSVSLLILLPLFKKGFLITDDGDLLLIRLGGVIRAIRNLHFPVRMLDLYHGYGYPVMNFLYPLPFYFASLIYFFLPIGLIATFKLSIYLFSVLAGIGAYLLVNQVSKNRMLAFLASVLYLSAPYRLIAIFYRGSIGEVLAHSLLPFLFYWIYLYKEENKNIYLIIFSFFVFLLIISHNVIALLSLLFLVFYNFFVLKNKKVWKYLILGILLSAFFSVPALVERKYTHAVNISLSDAGSRLILLKDLFLNTFSLKKYLPNIEKVFYLNISYLFILVFSLTALFLIKRKKKKQTKNIIFISALIFLIIFYVSTFSQSFWRLAKPLVPYIQFPWRLLSLLGLLFILLMSHVYKFYMNNKINNDKKKIIFWISIIFLFLSSVFSIYKSWQMLRYKQVDDAYYLTNQSSSTTQNEYTPIWVKEFPKEMPQNLIETSPEAKINILKRKTQKIVFRIDAKEKTLIAINKHYFPGWTLYVENEKKEFNKKNAQGIINFQLNKGKHQVELIFKETKLRLFADLISIIVFVYLLKLGWQKNENS